MNTGHRMRRDGQEFATSSCSTGQHAKVCRQDRGRVITVPASGTQKSGPKHLQNRFKVHKIEMYCT